MSKEELLKQYLGFSEIFNGHLTKLKSIPSQNFSSLDQKRMMTLQNGIDALKILAQKLEQFSEGGDVDVAVEKVAVEKAIDTAAELEGDQINKSQVAQEGDELIKKMFEAEDLTGMNDFKPRAGVPEDAKDMNDWTPEINSIEDMNEAFSQYVAQDYYRRATGREDFALHIGTKSISTNPKDYWKALKFWGRKTNKKLDVIGNNLGEHYPSVAGGIKTASQGALIGAALDIAISSLKRNLSYDEYVKNCKLEGIEPIEKSKYTLGTLEDLKKSVIRGGSLGAIGNLAIKGGKGAMEGLNKNLAAVNFALTPEDFQDASKIAEEQTLNTMKQSFSLSRGYYPGNNNAMFLEWLQDNADEYFSLRTDIYNQILEEANNFALNPTIGDTLKGAGIGAGVGGLSGLALAAIKKNKSYDTYKAESEAKGEKPLSRVAYIAKSKEFLKGGLIGAGAGAGVGAAIGGSGLGRKGVEGIKKLLGKSGSGSGRAPDDDGDRERIYKEAQKYEGLQKGIEKQEAKLQKLKAAGREDEKEYKDTKALIQQYKAEQKLLEKSYNLQKNKYETTYTALDPITGKPITKGFNPAKNDDAISKIRSKFLGKNQKGNYITDPLSIDAIRFADTQKGREARAQYERMINERNELIKRVGSASNKGPLSKKNMAEYNRIIGLKSGNLTEEDKLFLEKYGDKMKNWKGSDRDKMIKQLNTLNSNLGGFLNRITGKERRKILDDVYFSFFQEYGYYPTHSSDILFQNFCCQLVRDGYLQFKDLAYINFSYPQYQKDFAINKATVATGIASSIAGGIGGKLLANKKIKEEEKKLGRPLTQEERAKINRRFIAGGAIGMGAVGLGAAHGIQHAAGKGNATAQNIVNKVAGASNKVQELYGQGKAKVGELKHKGDRLYKKHIHGLSYDTQDMLEQDAAQNNALAQVALEKRKRGEALDAGEALALQGFVKQTKEGGFARKAMILGGLGMGYKFLVPMVQQAMASGVDVDESQIKAMVEKMQAEGKSEAEIKQAVQQQLQAAFFSYAQGFHRYY